MTRQNEPSYRKKGLSVFLTVIMILSVVAMSATFVGSVAAIESVDEQGGPTDVPIGIDEAQQNLTTTNISLDVNDSETVEINISLASLVANGVDLSDPGFGNETIQVEGNQSDEFFPSNVTISEDVNADDAWFNFSVSHDQGQDIEDLNITSLELTGLNTSEADAAEGLTYQVTATSVDEDDTETFDTASFNLGSPAPAQGPVAYFNNESSQSIEAVYDSDDINFDEAHIDDGNVSVWDKEGNDVTFDNVDLEGDDNRINVTGLNSNLTTGDNYLELFGVNHSITTTSSTFKESEDEVIDVGGNFSGERFAIHTLSEDGGVTITTPDDEFERSTGDESFVRVLETNRDWDGENVTVDFSDAGEIQTTLRDFGTLDISVSDVDEGEEIEVEVEGNRIIDRQLDLRLIDPDGDVNQSEFDINYDSEGVAEHTFDSVDEAGEWTVEATGTLTDISDDADFTVDDVVVDAEVEFGEITDAAEGDHAQIELEFEDVEDFGDGDVIVWINQSDYNLELNIDEWGDFENDSVTLQWNTYLAGEGNDAWEVLNDDNISVDVTDESTIDRGDDFRLNPAGYTLAVFGDGAAEERADSDSLSITERSTGELTTYVLSNSTDTDEGLEYIVDNMSESNDVAELDYLVVEQEITGVFGAYAEYGESLFEDNGAEITFEPDDVPAYQNPATFNLSEGDRADDLSLHLDEEEGVIYFLLEHTSQELEEDDTEDWDIEFEVTEDFAYIDDEDDEESTTGSYTLVERLLEISVVEEPYQVTPDENAVIEGTSTLAPHTNVTVTVDKPGHFIDSDDTVQITEDGEWVYTADYSDREIGEEFEIEVEETELDVASDEAAGSFNATPEADTQTTEQQLQDIVDDLTDMLDVEEDEIVDEVAQIIEDAEHAVETAEELEAYVAELEADLSEAQEDAQTWETLYDGAVEDLEQAEADLEQAQDDLEQAESDLSDAQDDIDQLESDLSDAEDTIDELNDEIDELEEDDGVPGFGPIAALFALLAGGALVARRRL